MIVALIIVGAIAWVASIHAQYYWGAKADVGTYRVRCEDVEKERDHLEKNLAHLRSEIGERNVLIAVLRPETVGLKYKVRSLTWQLRKQKELVSLLKENDTTNERWQRILRIVDLEVENAKLRRARKARS